MVPIDSAWVVSYLTSIDPIIVSVTVFAIFDVKFLWPWTRRVRGHLGSKFIVPVDSLWLVSYLTCFESNIVSLTVIFDIRATFTTVKSNSTPGWIFRISSKNSRQLHLLEYPDPTSALRLLKIGRKLRPVERSTHLCTSELWWSSGGYERILWELLCAGLCDTMFTVSSTLTWAVVTFLTDSIDTRRTDLMDSRPDHFSFAHRLRFSF